MDIIRKTLLVCTVFQVARTIDASCPNLDSILPCICANRNNDLQIWCTHSDLPQVAKGIQRIGNSLMHTIDELIIENNYLPMLPGKIFEHVKILRLMLRHNGLERLATDWGRFQERSLMELFIVENDLQTIPLDSISKLEGLQAITLQSNSLKNLPVFSHLPLLKYISIQSDGLHELNGDNFSDMPSLEKIFIKGCSNLQKINENVFFNLPKLKKMEISNCGIKGIHMRAMSLLPSLSELSLKGNKINDASIVGRAMRDLHKVTILDLSFNEMEVLNEASFVDLPAIEKLTLSNNKITEIKYGAFHRTPNLRIVDLNYNQINRIHPESFLQNSGSGVEELTLIGNQIMHISEFRALLDALPRLKFLDFSVNLLQEIPRGSLRGHPSLERLQLNDNNIKFIDVEAFVAMPALRELRLSNNSLSELQEGPYWNLPALKGLDLSKNLFSRLQPKLLYNLPALRRFDISNNKVTMIDPITFLESPLLEYVNISGNSLVSIHPATFRNSINLFELDSSSNRLVEFIPGLPRGMENLYLQKNQISSLPSPPSPDIDLPSLRFLDLSSNGIQKIPFGTMKMLPNLMRLYIRRNGLRHIEEATFSELEKLQILDIADNQIISIHPKSFLKLSNLNQVNLHGNNLENFDFNSLETNNALSKLDFSKNKLKRIAEHVLKRSVDVEVLNISSNNLNEFPHSLNALPRLKILDATNNQIKEFDGDALRTIHSLVELRMPFNNIMELKSGTFERSKELEVIHLERNQIEVFHPKAISMLPSLHSVFLGWNNIIELPEQAFYDLPQLRILELQGNRLQSISPVAFQDVPLIQFLNLSHNNLQNIDYTGLRNLVSLEVLDLSYNKIKKMSSATFEYMKWLVELHMDNNKICVITGKPFDYMPRLKILSLKYNDLTTVSESTFSKLKNNIAIFNIDGNPLNCNCRIIWLKVWLQDSYAAGPHCADGTFVKEIPFSRNDCQSKSLDLGPEPTCDQRDKAISPSLVTSQIFSPWDNKLKKPQLMNTNNVNKIPSPEESEYFYDEYVDFPYNETSVIQGLEGVNLPEKKSNTQINKKSEQILDKSTATTDKTVPNLSNSKTTSNNSGFTFFGMHLPPLNMGKLWNTGRKIDWPITESKPHNGKNYPKFQYEQPKFETGGFAPMLPTTSSGFKPILDPNLANKTYHTYYSNTTDMVLQLAPNAKNMSDITSAVINNKSISTNVSLPVTKSNTTKNHTKVKNIIHEKIEFATNDNKTKVTYNKTKTLQENTKNQGKLTNYDLMEKNITVTDEADLKNILITTDTSNDMSVQPWPETTTTYASQVYLNTKTPKDSPTRDNPSALSAILAPNDGERTKKNLARPATITKVSMPHSDFDDNVGDYTYLPINNREPKKGFGDRSDITIRRNYIDKTKDWYYRNYNNSNIEPYITPGVTKSGVASLNLCSICLYITSMYMLLIIFPVA